MSKDKKIDGTKNQVDLLHQDILELEMGRLIHATDTQGISVISIPKQVKEIILRSLQNEYGISFASLFPGIHGYVRGQGHALLGVRYKEAENPRDGYGFSDSSFLSK